ncbi:class I SAM-dependent methyltransferase [Alteribacillus bidgolensis]|nr:class I SAM-dependent methyltransferase [Alteribacillus bidgolensis]
MDLSEGMIKKARELAKTRAERTSSAFIVGDAYALPFKDGTLDVFRRWL